MSTMFGNAPSDKITFGCVQVNPRISRGDSSYRGAWRGAARAANARIKLLEDPIDRTNEKLYPHHRHFGLGGRDARPPCHSRLQQLLPGGDAGRRPYRWWRRLQGPRLHVQLAQRAHVVALPAGRRQRRGGRRRIASIPGGHPARQPTSAPSTSSPTPWAPQQLMRVMGSIREILDSRRHDEGMLRLGQVVFAAPDVSAAVFNTKILTWAKLAQRVTIYTSRRRLGALAVIVPARLQRSRRRAYPVGAIRCTSTPATSTSSTRHRPSTTSGSFSRTRTPTMSMTKQSSTTSRPSSPASLPAIPANATPDGKVFRAQPYAGMSDKKYWETLRRVRSLKPRTPSKGQKRPSRKL